MIQRDWTRLIALAIATVITLGFTVVSIVLAVAAQWSDAGIALCLAYLAEAKADRMIRKFKESDK